MNNGASSVNLPHQAICTMQVSPTAGLFLLWLEMLI